MIDALYFCHIQKTAGTSVLALLDRYFAATDICPQQLWPGLAALPLRERQQYRLYAGHFGAGGMRALIGRDLPMMTFLREPAALARSTYLHLLRESDHRFVGALKSTHSAHEFLSDPRVRGVFRSRQCASLSFDVERDPCAERVFFSNQALTLASDYAARSNSIVSDDQRLKRARAVLEQTAFFGLVERMPESLALFAHTFCLPHPGGLERLREAPPQKIDFSRFDALAAEGNAHDQTLYAFATELFEQRLARMHVDLKRFRPHALKPWTWHRRKEPSAALDARFAAENKSPAQASLDFAGPVFAANLHRREGFAAGGCFRWTGPSSDPVFWIKPERAIRTLAVTVIDAASDQHVIDTTASTNHVPAAVVASRSRPWQLTISPSRALAAKRWHRIALHTPPALAHRAHHAGSRDERRVALAIGEVSF